MSALQTAMNSIVDLEQQILKLKSERAELLEALERIELDARIARPYVGQTKRLGEIAHVAIAKAEGKQA
jgi:hypothetical protein